MRFLNSGISARPKSPVNIQKTANIIIHCSHGGNSFLLACSTAAAPPGLAHILAFSLIFRLAIGLPDANYGLIPLFDRFLPVSSRFSMVKEALQDVNWRRFMHLNGKRRRPNRIKIEKSRILFPFPGKHPVKKAPGVRPRREYTCVDTRSPAAGLHPRRALTLSKRS
ncbi:MAG: hypothetical protein II184_03105, partial [Clostridia bacterium]|nr:hypothetical protein [Clostridia bacterium]